jgi:hypothetical protein
MPNISSVLIRSHGLAVDHVALAVPDMEGAVGEIHALTGVEPRFADPEPGQWYWSAALGLGTDSFLEILGPNPGHAGFHPLKALISGYRSPQVLFWYVATDDFDGLARKIKESGSPVERVETVRFDRDGRGSHYKRGIIGPGFMTQRPCVIEWRQRVEGLWQADAAACGLKRLELRHPAAEPINALFAALGVELTVLEGPSWIGVELETPNGLVRFENEGTELAGLSGYWRMARLYVRHLASRAG